MRKRLFTFFAFTLVLLLVACGNSDDNEGANDKETETPEMLEVELEVETEVKPGETVPLKAIVTQGDEKVSDADEVEYEVWEENKKEDSEMIEAENEGDGVYTAEKTFDDEGVYVVQVHVTARGQHNMPKETITVGDGETHNDHETEGEDGVSMHWMEPKDVKTGENTELMVHVQDGDDPLEKAKVTFEIKNIEKEDEEDSVEAEETKPGEYVSSYEFTEAGTYELEIHVENDDDVEEKETHKLEVK